MKRALALLAVVLVLSAAMLPDLAWAGGWHHGHHGGWWWPGALIGGLVVGAFALATAPLWALAPPPPPVVQPAPAVYSQPVYAPAQPAYAAAPTQPVYAAAPVAAPPAPAYTPPQPPPFQREVVYQDGRYLLFGDGVHHAWQWVWVPATAPPSPPAPPR
jgi:hypothetical protein